MATIESVKLNKPLEFLPYVNPTGCSGEPLGEDHNFILSESVVQNFVDELASLNRLDLIEETLQSLYQRKDGTPLKTAFPNIKDFRSVAAHMNSIPQELKNLLDTWVELGAHEIDIIFEAKRN